MVKQFIILTLLLIAGSAWASSDKVAGMVYEVDGPLFAVNASGKKRVLEAKSALREGETIMTGVETTSRLVLNDGGFIQLAPRTEFTIEEYNFKGENESSNQSIFSLAKGTLRFLTGLVGKPNQGNYALKTPTATIGVRGTDFTINVSAKGVVTLMTNSGQVVLYNSRTGKNGVPVASDNVAVVDSLSSAPLVGLLDEMAGRNPEVISYVARYGTRVGTTQRYSNARKVDGQINNNRESDWYRDQSRAVSELNIRFPGNTVVTPDTLQRYINKVVEDLSEQQKQVLGITGTDDINRIKITTENRRGGGSSTSVITASPASK